VKKEEFGLFCSVLARKQGFVDIGKKGKPQAKALIIP
jgi:hypothetical protein